MCARRKQSVIFKIDRTMNYFATQVIELCNGGMDANLTIIALAYIEIELQHHPVRNLSEERKEIAAYISKALSFIRKMQKFLATPQVPPLISANNATENTASLLQWTRWVVTTTAICRSNSLPRFFTRYSGLSRRTATASTPISNAGRTKAAPTSLTGCRRN